MIYRVKCNISPRCLWQRTVNGVHHFSYLETFFQHAKDFHGCEAEEQIHFTIQREVVHEQQASNTPERLQRQNEVRQPRSGTRKR